MKNIFLITVMGLLGAKASTQQPLFDTLRHPQLISRQFIFTEGPAADKAGNIYFTDQPNNRIWKYDTAGRLSVFMADAGRANGMYFDKKGNLIACADEHDQLWSITPGKKVTVLVKDFDGHRLNGPNDCWVDAHGGVYFTDPYYQRDYWDRKQTDLDGEKVYYLPKAGKPFIVEDQLKKPNGIIGTPDGKYVYIADIGAGKTYRYRIDNGLLKDKQLFCSQGSDGMTLDAEGNVYLTGKGVTVYNRSGQKIAHIDINEPWTANVCFGGNDHHLLFITASTAVYTLHMNVKGAD